ncbi:hypothetical protein [Polaribacter gochangensis]|uniref:hypothetical protein n=1 Tax=Polaribacter gochangensis TaxID=3252903 RepID=UPI0039048487
MIIEYENTLRKLIIYLFGKDGESYKISAERLEKWKEKKEIQNKKNNGVLLEKRLIFYSDFYDLKTIINKNWLLFLPFLKNKKRFEIFFKEVENYRNTIAHGRNLTLGQEHLLNGILSDLKNSITIYHNKNEMKQDYFLRITQVSDNLGNVWDNIINQVKPTLRVGDDYEIIIEANDPKDREIEYCINTISNELRIEQKSNRFNFKIENNLVGEHITFLVSAFTPSSTYENKTGFGITFTILPQE